MKKLWITGLLILVGSTVYSQDIIVKNNGTEIKSDVKEITIDDVIKYKRYNHPEGPIRNIRAKKVFMIIYENGKREIFKNDEDSSEVNEETEEPSDSDADTTSQETDKTESGNEENNVTNQDTETDGKDTSETSQDDSSEPVQEKDMQPVSPESSSNEHEYFALSAGYGTTYGLQGLNIGYRFGTIALHGGIGGFISANSISYSVGARIFTDDHLFFDIQVFNSSILSAYNIEMGGATIQAGGDLPLGDVVALSGTGGLAYFFDLGGTAFTWNGGIKLRF